jgi:hypothetical protein
MQPIPRYLDFDIVDASAYVQGGLAREPRPIHDDASLAAALPGRPALARRALAQGLAVVSRGSAAAVRRLDDVVADDLGRALAPGK